jgi:hypothetical protein
MALSKASQCIVGFTTSRSSSSFSSTETCGRYEEEKYKSNFSLYESSSPPLIGESSAVVLEREFSSLIGWFRRIRDTVVVRFVLRGEASNVRMTRESQWLTSLSRARQGRDVLFVRIYL